mmetsp:Transcript_30871/g.51328  ORF Transcript_30871/g.51328 Transcript_30871/m.51328 type:complete len:409 (-) Transcript_30871:1238-2464(-)
MRGTGSCYNSSAVYVNTIKFSFDSWFSTVVPLPFHFNKPQSKKPQPQTEVYCTHTMKISIRKLMKNGRPQSQQHPSKSLFSIVPKGRSSKSNSDDSPSVDLLDSSHRTVRTYALEDSHPSCGFSHNPGSTSSEEEDSSLMDASSLPVDGNNDNNNNNASEPTVESTTKSSHGVPAIEEESGSTCDNHVDEYDDDDEHEIVFEAEQDEAEPQERSLKYEEEEHEEEQSAHHEDLASSHHDSIPQEKTNEQGPETPLKDDDGAASVTAEAVATAIATAPPSDDGDTPKRQVHFGQLEIYEHALALGGAVPSCGPPLTMEWDAQAYFSVPIEDYEECRPGKPRKGTQLLRSKKQRTELLLSSGYTMREINEWNRECEEIRKQRSKSSRQFSAWRFLGLHKSFQTIRKQKSL